MNGKQSISDGKLLDLVKVARISWSLLNSNEKFFFSFRVVVRLALNLLDILGVALMGLLGALTATGLSGQDLRIMGVEIPLPSASNVVLLISSVAFLFFLRGGLAILFSRWTAIFLAGIEVKNTAKITRYLFSGSLERIRSYTRAEITFLVNHSTSATFSGVLGSLTTLLIEGTMFVSIFIVFVVVDWVAAIGIAIYFVVLIAVLQLLTARRFLQSGKNMRSGAVDSGNSLLEMIDGFREISVLSKQNFFLTRLIEATKLQARTNVTLQILKSLPAYVAQGGLILGAVGFIAWQLNQGDLAEGLIALGIFLAGSFRMMGAILPLQALWNDLRVMQDWVVLAQTILVQLRNTPEILDSRIYSQTAISEPVFSERSDRGLSVEVSNLAFQHQGQSDLAVKNVNFRVASGSFVAIVGPSGSGKSTLVDLILGLYSPMKGKVLIDGKYPKKFMAEFPGLIAYVPQKPGIVSGSVAQNVALGLAKEDIDEGLVWESLHRAQLAQAVEGLPSGIHSSLGNHSDGLSGGQLQRLGLARALYTNPSLLILDEATSALDASTEASISTSIRSLSPRTTVIVIAHRLSTIQNADVVHVMNDGSILASGGFKEVRKKVPMIEEYVKLMSFDDV